MACRVKNIDKITKEVGLEIIYGRSMNTLSCLLHHVFLKLIHYNKFNVRVMIIILCNNTIKY